MKLAVVGAGWAGLAAAVEAEGLRCVVAPTIMKDPPASAALGRTVLEAAG